MGCLIIDPRARDELSADFEDKTQDVSDDLHQGGGLLVEKTSERNVKDQCQDVSDDLHLGIGCHTQETSENNVNFNVKILFDQSLIRRVSLKKKCSNYQRDIA